MDLPQTPPFSSEETIPYMADGAAVSKGSSPPSDDALQLSHSTLTTQGSSPETEPQEHALREDAQHIAGIGREEKRQKCLQHIIAPSCQCWDIHIINLGV